MTEDNGMAGNRRQGTKSARIIALIMVIKDTITWKENQV